jgi:tetratricopeptide (TPR) repeat protein
LIVTTTGYAVFLEKRGNIKKALELLQKSVKYNPSHAASWVALAGIHRREGRLEEARRCYSSAIENDPNSYVALQAWGVLEAEMGDVETARSLFAKGHPCRHSHLIIFNLWRPLHQTYCALAILPSSTFHPSSSHVSIAFRKQAVQVLLSYLSRLGDAREKQWQF